MTDTTNAVQPFEPARHLTRISGSDYLEVKWRLVWMRDQHPDATITTELVKLDRVTAGNGKEVERAIFRAHVSVPGGGEATGYGSETENDFRDHIEKAETKAIGRALAALGFGTQFCDDHDFGSAAGRVVDSPVQSRGNGNRPPAGAPAADRSPLVTQQHLNALHGAAQKAGGYDHDHVLHQAYWRYNVMSTKLLTQRQNSQLIGYYNKQDFIDGPPMPRRDPQESEEIHGREGYQT
jgi:hypothetical protein